MLSAGLAGLLYSGIETNTVVGQRTHAASKFAVHDSILALCARYIRALGVWVRYFRCVGTREHAALVAVDALAKGVDKTD